jgi:hypothetical protein
MAEGLVDMSKQFGNLPMEDLIGGPLIAAANANSKMIMANAEFIQDVGFKKDKDGNIAGANMASFGYKQQLKDGTVQDMEISVPVLAIVPLPALKVEEAEVTFSMQVNSSTEDTSETESEAGFEGSASYNAGIFKASVKVHGKTSSKSSHTRKSDNSAKYDVHVIARDSGTPEGLNRVLDILHDAISPVPTGASDGGE